MKAIIGGLREAPPIPAPAAAEKAAFVTAETSRPVLGRFPNVDARSAIAASSSPSAPCDVDARSAIAASSSPSAPCEVRAQYGLPRLS